MYSTGSCTLNGAELVLRVADHVAQHADEAVGAGRQQEGEPQRLRRSAGMQVVARQVAELGRGLEHALHRDRAHAGPPVEHAVDRRGRYAGAGDVAMPPTRGAALVERCGRCSVLGSTLKYIKNHQIHEFDGQLIALSSASIS